MAGVKDFRIEEEPTTIDLGRDRFVFSGRYSMFNWGEMLDHAPNKGVNLCLMGAYDFELLDVNHVPTHYLGVVKDGKVKELGECESSPTEVAIELTQVPDPPHADGAYDYNAYRGAAGGSYLVPLEIVFCNTVPVGSSLRQRGEPTDYGLELDKWPDETVFLPEPVVEFPTKYEGQDRYLSRAEADNIVGEVDLGRLEELALAVNHVLAEHADEADLDHEDGKIECFYCDGTVKVGDMVGMFNENRFSYGGRQVSKEVVQQYYKRVQPEWVGAVKDAKAEAIETGESSWRRHCAVEPDHLPADIIGALSDLYCAGANAYIDHGWFDAPTVENAAACVRDL